MLVTKPYNRERAVEYAKRWALDRNPLFVDFTEIGGNCTNFVSQAVLAGSCTMNYTPDFAHETFCEPGEYTLPIIVHVYTDVTNLGLFPEYAAEVGFGTDELIRYLPSLSADTPLVIHADFPGDMTTYILRFDANGRTYEYYIYQSGRTGLAEYYQTAP